ncbi:MAG: hypothetical protein QOE70_3654 [Chthoniobacter sp.]|jgi:hypothetical protein|nr:hypothetical protein [Chthoniobacter sp.]
MAKVRDTLLSLSAPMKLLLFVLLVTGLQSTIADVEDKLESLATEIRETHRTQAKVAARARELSARMQKLPRPANAADNQRLRMELKETQQMIEVLAGRERESQARLRQLQSSPEHRLLTAISNDRRHPTKADVSGVWTSTPNLVGYVLQLEQRGDSVTGRGYHWGCLGIYDFFQITGSNRAGLLSLTFASPERKNEKHDFHYLEDRRRPRFEAKQGKRTERIIPWYELDSLVARPLIRYKQPE